MANKPRIWAFGDAGSRFETVHKSDFDNVAAFVEVPIEYTDEGRAVAYIEPCKKYRIYSNTRSTNEAQFEAKVSVTIGAFGSGDFAYNLKYVEKPVSYTAKDNYDFEFLGVQSIQIDESSNTYDVEYAYTINGVLHKETTSITDGSTTPNDAIERLVVVDATKVLQINENAVTERPIMTVKTIDGKDIRFFWGTNAEYELLTEAETQGLFALITDEAKIHQHNIRLQFSDGAVVLFSFLSKKALPCEDYEALTTLLTTARTQTDNEGHLTTGMLSATGVNASGYTIYGIEQYIVSGSAVLKLHLNQNGANSLTVGTPSLVIDNVIEL